jgi:hypothetical protein
MTVDSDSLLLKIGLEVSAKFKGAFCEARIRAVDPDFRLKLRFPDGRTAQEMISSVLSKFSITKVFD